MILESPVEMANRLFPTSYADSDVRSCVRDAIRFDRDQIRKASLEEADESQRKSDDISHYTPYRGRAAVLRAVAESLKEKL